MPDIQPPRDEDAYSRLGILVPVSREGRHLVRFVGFPGVEAKMEYKTGRQVESKSSPLDDSCSMLSHTGSRNPESRQRTGRLLVYYIKPRQEKKSYNNTYVTAPAPNTSALNHAMSKRIAPPVGAGDDELATDDADPGDPFVEEALEPAPVPVDLQMNYQKS